MKWVDVRGTRRLVLQSWLLTVPNVTEIGRAEHNKRAASRSVGKYRPSNGKGGPLPHSGHPTFCSFSFNISSNACPSFFPSLFRMKDTSRKNNMFAQFRKNERDKQKLIDTVAKQLRGLISSHHSWRLASAFSGYFLQLHILGSSSSWHCFCAFFFKENICIFLLTLYSIHIIFSW